MKKAKAHADQPGRSSLELGTVLASVNKGTWCQLSDELQGESITGMPPEMDPPFESSSHTVAASDASAPITTEICSGEDSSTNRTEPDVEAEVEQQRRKLESQRKHIGILRRPLVTLR